MMSYLKLNTRPCIQNYQIDLIESFELLRFLIVSVRGAKKFKVLIEFREKIFTIT